MKIVHEEDYMALRQREYPPLEDFADAMVHDSRGNPLPLQEYLAACEAVKVKYPKPTEK